ncbi:hypothetical protein H1C71_007915, partial [Ictidomys tridecemlineatus]
GSAGGSRVAVAAAEVGRESATARCRGLRVPGYAEFPGAFIKLGSRGVVIFSPQDPGLPTGTASGDFLWKGSAALILLQISAISVRQSGLWTSLWGPGTSPSESPSLLGMLNPP